MNFKKLVAKLLEEGQLTLADLVLDLEATGLSYKDVFGFKPEVDTLVKIKKDLEKELANA